MTTTHYASLARDFGDGEYVFRLPFHLVVQLEEKRGCGPMVILDRLQSGLWMVEDIRETIRLGLIGGGLDPQRALALTRTYVEARPALENVGLAYMILAKALTGAPEPSEAEGGGGDPPSAAAPQQPETAKT